ncbi:unnamed protein product, partial [marine sediment metagenome]
MRDYFRKLTEELSNTLQGKEVLLCSLNGEQSDFCRFNQGRVRQVGNVEQNYISLSLVDQDRVVSSVLGLSHQLPIDRKGCQDQLAALRSKLPAMPVDPWLAFETRPGEVGQPAVDQSLNTKEHLRCILAAAGQHDLVGIYSGGLQYGGYRSSLG